MYANALVAVDDFGAARDALALAQRLVAADGRLALAYVQVIAPKPSASSGAVREAEEHERALAALERFRTEQNSDAELITGTAVSVATGLHELARQHAADLIVVGASRIDPVDRLLEGDDTRAVLDGAPCAVAVAPAGYAAQAPGFARVGVAADGSGDEAAAQVAHALGAASQATVTEVPTKGVDGQELEESTRGVDLLVIGPHRYRPADRFFGNQSVAQTLSERSPAALLVLPAAHDKSNHVQGGHRWQTTQ